jgi:hypothetical protein
VQGEQRAFAVKDVNVIKNDNNWNQIRTRKMV